MNPIRPCFAWLAVVASAMATYAATPATAVGIAAYAIVSIGATVAVVLGLHRGLPPDPLPWRLIAATLASFAVGDLAFLLTYDRVTREAPLADTAYLVGYGLLLWAIGRMMLRGVTGPDLTAPLDAIVLAIALAPLAWALLEGRAGPWPGPGVVLAITIAYPLADIALLAAVILLLINGAWRLAAGRLLCAAVASLLAADIAAGWLRLNDIDPETSHANLLWMAAAGALGAAALHPSMAALSRSTAHIRESRGRFVLLALATLAAPVLVAAQAAGVLTLAATPVAAAAVVVSVLVAGRIVGIGGRLEAALARYQSLVEQIPAAVYTRTPGSDRLAYASPRFRDLLGCQPDAIVGASDFIDDCVHPEDRARVEAEDARTDETGDPFVSEYRLRAVDGTWRWVRNEARLVRDESGHPLQWQGVLTDVSAVKGAEEALRQHASRLEAVIEAQIAVAAVEPDPQEVMDVVAARARVLVGADGAAVELVDDAEIVYRAAAGTAAVYLGRRRPLEASLSGLCVRSGDPQISDDAETDPRVDVETVRRSGTRSSIVVPLHHRSRVVGVLKAIDGEAGAFDADDVRALQLLAGLIGNALANAEAYAVMREARAAAEEASRLKSEFLSTMSHELRTPMNAIIGYAHLLLDGMAGDLTMAQANDVRRIAEGADRLLALVDDVLDLSRIEAGRLAVEPRPVRLHPVVAQALAGVTPQAAAKGLPVLSRLPENLPQVLADPDRLCQALLNIFGNAVKFTERGSVDVSARAEDGSVVVTVADTGIGIAPEALPHIFDEFRQADSSTTRRFGGSGLGLAITRRLLALQGGSIAVDSTPGVGSTFTVKMPAAGATADDAWVGAEIGSQSK